jgi:hypothetical protein
MSGDNAAVTVMAIVRRFDGNDGFDNEVVCLTPGDGERYVDANRGERCIIEDIRVVTHLPAPLPRYQASARISRRGTDDDIEALDASFFGFPGLDGPPAGEVEVKVRGASTAWRVDVVGWDGAQAEAAYKAKIQELIELRGDGPAWRCPNCASVQIDVITEVISTRAITATGHNYLTVAESEPASDGEGADRLHCRACRHDYDVPDGVEIRA